MRKLITLAAVFGITGGVAPLSAQTLSEADRVVFEQTSEWLELIDVDDYAGSWEATAPMFKVQVTPQQWEEAGRQVRSQTGQLVDRELREVTRTSPPGVPAGEYRVVRFGSEYENIAAAVETVILREEADDDWRVVGYFVRPG